MSTGIRLTRQMGINRRLERLDRTGMMPGRPRVPARLNREDAV